jgi:hypothetical protein
MFVSDGMESKNAPNAASPPAEAPIPTTVSRASLFEGSWGAGASSLSGFFVADFGDCLGFVVFFSAILLLLVTLFHANGRRNLAISLYTSQSLYATT